MHFVVDQPITVYPLSLTMRASTRRALSLWSLEFA